MMVDNSFSTSSSVLSSKSTWAHFPICKMGLTLPSPKVTREYETVDSGKQVKRVQKTFTTFCLSRRMVDYLPSLHWWEASARLSDYSRPHSLKASDPRCSSRKDSFEVPQPTAPITAAWMDLLVRVLFLPFSSSIPLLSAQGDRPQGGRKWAD